MDVEWSGVGTFDTAWVQRHSCGFPIRWDVSYQLEPRPNHSTLYWIININCFYIHLNNWRKIIRFIRTIFIQLIILISTISLNGFSLEPTSNWPTAGNSLAPLITLNERDERGNLAHDKNVGNGDTYSRISLIRNCSCRAIRVCARSFWSFLQSFVLLPWQ